MATPLGTAMKPLNIILLCTALSVTSHAHSQMGSAGILGGLLSSGTGLASQSALPVVSSLLASNELVGSLTGLSSELLNTTLNTALPFPVDGLDVVITAIDGLTASGTALELGGLTPLLLNITDMAAIPLIGGATEGAIF